MCKLTYIWHDGFVYEDDSVIIVFDFWKDPLAGDCGCPSFIEDADKSKRLYVLVSHHHKDHYTRKIFEWGRMFEKTRYILSTDVAKYCRHILKEDSIYAGPRPRAESVTVMKAGDVFEDDVIKVEAFGSTDIGNSYALTVSGKSIFHAGDLNAWIWKDESTDEEVNKAVGDFRRILTTIQECHKGFDIAMFPVDSRIGTGYYTGARIFVRTFDVAHFFPMHFGLGDTEEQQIKYARDASRIELYANPERGEYICLQAPYASYSEP